MTFSLFDTHTHFDVPDFDHDREHLAALAKNAGVEACVLIGFIAERFEVLIQIHRYLNQLSNAPKSYLAPGLHPFYIEQHDQADLQTLEHILLTEDCVAIGEIGLDTFLPQHKVPEIFQKQKQFFSAQLDLASQHEKPVLLHVRKAHADTLALLKKHHFKLGGIAHAFSGGVEEAKAFIKLGFKLGITGQITNPNAKKLHRVIQEIGAEHFVIETDCPDMTPLCCQSSHEHRTRNTPANLIYVFQAYAEILQLDEALLAQQLWKNTQHALKLSSS